MPSWASNWIADMPFECVAMRCAAQNHTLSATLDRCIAVPAVIAPNSSFTYKGQAIDVKQVGRELGVRYVLEGSVRKGGNRVRITAQLVDATTGAHMWAD